MEGEKKRKRTEGSGGRRATHIYVMERTADRTSGSSSSLQLRAIA